MRRIFVRLYFVSIAALAGMPMAAFAQTAYPQRIVRIIAGFPPGGFADFRAVSLRLTE